MVLIRVDHIADNATSDMAEVIVQEWLSDFKCLSPAELHSFANTICQNTELIQAIFTTLEEKKYHQELLEPICHQLFSFYRSREEELQRFTLQYLPTLIGLYMCGVARGDRKCVRSVEVLLLGIYNLEVIDSEGKPVCHTFRMPSVSKPSIYHEPISLPHSQLTEHALSKLESGDNLIITIGPYAEVEKITACNRLQVMSVLMRIYNQYVGLMPKLSHLALCKMCSIVVKQGYSRSGQRSYYVGDSGNFGNPHPKQYPRIPVSPAFLLEMLHTIYFCMFNGLSSPGLQALEDIHFRATQELYTEVLLVTSGIRNSLKVNPSGQPDDGPMGISVALSPTTATTTVSKAIITNASFRTKKLPDDIPIQSSKDDEQANDGRQLSSISEETEDMDRSTRSSSSAPSSSKGKEKSGGNMSSVPKLPVLQLRKNKTKKDKDSANVENNIDGSTKPRKDQDSNSTVVLKSSLKHTVDVPNGTDSAHMNDGDSGIACYSSMDPLSLSESQTVTVLPTDGVLDEHELKGISDNLVMTRGGVSLYSSAPSECHTNNGHVVQGDGPEGGSKMHIQATVHKQEMHSGVGRQPSVQTVV